MLSSFSVTGDLASCTRCGGMRSVGLDEFRRRVEGRPFRFLLRYHLRHHDAERLRRGLEGSLAVLPPAARELALEAGERWEAEVLEGDLASRDCAALVDRAGELLRASPDVDGPAGDDRVLDVFEVATLSLALAALEDDALREAVGGAGDGAGPLTGWWSLAAAVVLLYVATRVEDPVWQAVVWACLGLVVLPPVARLVAGTGARDG